MDEELSRLRAHLEEVERILSRGGAIGKRLDFLMQELNREANTLAAKSVDAEVSKISVELKVLIEQMREQVQNRVGYRPEFKLANASFFRNWILGIRVASMPATARLSLKRRTPSPSACLLHSDQELS